MGEKFIFAWLSWEMPFFCVITEASSIRFFFSFFFFFLNHFSLCYSTIQSSHQQKCMFFFYQCSNSSTLSIALRSCRCFISLSVLFNDFILLSKRTLLLILWSVIFYNKTILYFSSFVRSFVRLLGWIPVHFVLIEMITVTRWLKIYPEHNGRNGTHLSCFSITDIM